MATTADYLNKLVEQKNTLADNLVTQGVSATHDETLETLVPKVLEISGGGEGNGIYPVGEDGRPTGDVTVPNGVTSLHPHVFQETSVTSVKLPESLISLNAYAFNNCKKLNNITFSNSSTNVTIDNDSFQNCTSLIDVIINDDAEFSFKDGVFKSCTSLSDSTAINILNHSNSIGHRMFDRCTSLQNMTAKIINNSTFQYCTGLISCVITTDVTTMPPAVFYNCTSLKTIYLPSTITSDTYNSLTSTSSSYYVFYNCMALEDVQLGQDWNMSLRLDVSNNITVESMVAMFDSLKDLTGETAKTLTLGATNLAKLTDEQKLIATNKNWTLA